MLFRGTLLLPDAHGAVQLRQGAISVKDGLIDSVDIEPSGAPLSPDSGPIIAPAFTDTHFHLPQFDSIGIDGLELLEWLQQVVFPAEARWSDEAYARNMVSRVARQLARAGTVGIGAYATVHHAAAAGALRALGDAGFRGVVGQVLMDQGAPAEITRPAAQLLDEASSLEGRGRIEPAVTPRFAPTCSRGLLEGAGALAREKGWAVQTHLAETRPECRLVRQTYPEQSYTAVYQQAGLLGPRTLLGHVIWIDDDERGVLRDTQSVICHCPTSNVFLQSGDMDAAAHTATDLRLSLATDVAAGPDRSMVRVARSAIDVARRVHPDARALTAEWGWWQITRGNAIAMGCTSAGSLEVGQAADLVVIEPDIAWERSPDPLGTLLYAWDDRWISATLARGETLYRAPVA